ncbi:hypothetical protein QUB80_06545 [Chlorogloeopsis sp. ULAP01]|uniref:hypothetical protein n=1 Tax=Chlorogloeopsis sp. ULAP01 TaxID=3056483 RepID=UPI0025AB5A68|nr:hypothetical protein [Chlorogloeopsis sp. ULAP01]MDM9380360.1 hypothetical protein [Chlorogloeopsis sp. ULAP01]
MEWYNTSEQFMRQMNDFQRTTFENWSSMFPGTQNFSMSSYRDNLNKALSFQESLLSNSLEVQAQLSRMYIDTQKQFLQGYFNILRNWYNY